MQPPQKTDELVPFILGGRLCGDFGEGIKDDQTAFGNRSQLIGEFREQALRFPVPAPEGLYDISLAVPFPWDDRGVKVDLGKIDEAYGPPSKTHHPPGRRVQFHGESQTQVW